jgi:hypothetical protein
VNDAELHIAGDNVTIDWLEKDGFNEPGESRARLSARIESDFLRGLYGYPEPDGLHSFEMRRRTADDGTILFEGIWRNESSNPVATGVKIFLFPILELPQRQTMEKDELIRIARPYNLKCVY